MTKAQIIDKYIQRIMVDYPEADKIHIDLVQFAEELRQCDVSGAMPPPSGKYAQLQENVRELLLFAEPDGWIVNGFRTLEVVTKLRQLVGGNDR